MGGTPTMSEPTPPLWVDDLFPFPTPPALATLVDIAWQHATAEGYYDWLLLATHFDFMFDLAAVPRPLAGWICEPEFDGGAQQRHMPMFAMPEFLPVGSLGDGGYVGWVVPAPELGLPDHPMCHADGHEHGIVQLGHDTKAGLEFLLSRTLRKWRQRTVDPDDRELVDLLVRVLGVHPDPDCGEWPGRGHHAHVRPTGQLAI